MGVLRGTNVRAIEGVEWRLVCEMTALVLLPEVSTVRLIHGQDVLIHEGDL